jgi:hypothetical protein
MCKRDCNAMTLLCVIMLIASGCKDEEGMSPEDRALEFGANGTSYLIDVVSPDGPTVRIIDPVGRTGVGHILDGVHAEPGGVLVVGIPEWEYGTNTYESGHILLSYTKKKLVLAPPGTHINFPNGYPGVGGWHEHKTYVVAEGSKVSGLVDADKLVVRTQEQAPDAKELTTEDGELEFGANGICVLHGVDPDDPERVAIEGSIIIVNSKATVSHELPGGVLVVGVSRWEHGTQTYEYGHILLRNTKKELVIAPPGTSITISEEQYILSELYEAGTYVVPADSKFPGTPGKNRLNALRKKPTPAISDQEAGGSTSTDSAPEEPTTAAVTIKLTKEQLAAIMECPRDLVFLTSRENPVRSLSGLSQEEVLICTNNLGIADISHYEGVASTDYERAHKQPGFVGDISRLLREGLSFQIDEVRVAGTSSPHIRFDQTPSLRLVVAERSCVDSVVEGGGGKIRFEE